MPVHEFSKTMEIVEVALKEAKKRNAKRVLEVRVQIGELTFLQPEQVRFSFNVLAQGTIMEGAKLRLEKGKAHVRCESCGYEGKLNYVDRPEFHYILPSLECPKCKGIVEIVHGRECVIKAIRIEI
jgi:hydrogenase nickel incorporation protein HypA/HybF